VARGARGEGYRSLMIIFAITDVYANDVRQVDGRREAISDL
jgi:hypothetical protein